MWYSNTDIIGQQTITQFVSNHVLVNTYKIGLDYPGGGGTHL